ncbi:MAG: hypothetical protein ACE5JL_10695, partial [Dehalococcoidia bacterium]
MKSPRRDLRILFAGILMVCLLPLPANARTHEPGTSSGPLRLGPLQVEGRFSGDLFLRGRHEGGTVKPLRADALEWRNRTRGETRFLGVEDSALAGQGILTLLLEGETSDGSPVLSFSELAGEGAPKGYALKSTGIVLSDLFKASLGGPSLGLRYGFLPPTFHVTNGEFLEYDEDVRFYQLGASARLPFSRLLLQEVVLGASAISTTFDPEITTRESFNLSDLYRLEWAVTASPQPPLSLRYAGS